MLTQIDMSREIVRRSFPSFRNDYHFDRLSIKCLGSASTVAVRTKPPNRNVQQEFNTDNNNQRRTISGTYWALSVLYNQNIKFMVQCVSSMYYVIIARLKYRKWTGNRLAWSSQSFIQTKRVAQLDRVILYFFGRICTFIVLCAQVTRQIDFCENQCQLHHLFCDSRIQFPNHSLPTCPRLLDLHLLFLCQDLEGI